MADTENNRKARDVWAAAFNQPGTPQSLGRIVICDRCDGDWTDRPESGGLIVGSHANCPDCEAAVRAGLKDFGEEHLAVLCLPGISFADWVRALRGPQAFVKVTLG